MLAVENDCCSWESWSISCADGALVMHAGSTEHGVEALHEMFR